MIKTCEVRLIKLNIDNIVNQKLLNMDGRPGKFYLDGFAPHEFVKLTKLITNYGGIVMSPDDETIILSKSDRSSNMKFFPLFHVNWLHDSLTQNTLQDIGKYLLPNYLHDSPRMISGTRIKIREIPKEFNQKTTPTQSNEYNGRSSRILKSQDSQKTVSQIIKNESKNVLTTEHQKRSSQEQKMKHLSKKERKKRLSDSENNSVEIKKKKKENDKNKSRSDDDTDAEKTINIFDESKDSSFQENADDMTPDSTNEAIIRVTTDAADDDVNTEEGRDSVLNENECNDSIKETSFVKKKNKRSSEGKDHIKRTSKSYSHEENLKIFQFLADNNFLAKANRDFVWEKAEASEIFQDPPRTASGLRQHFQRILLPNYLEYTSDPEVIAELAKIENRKLKNIIGYFNVKKVYDEDSSDSGLSD